MKFSKKDLLSLLNENIDEMAMNFDTQDRPDSGLQNKLQQGDTPLKKVPLPKTGQEPNQNFQEVLASERYKQVVANIRRYTNYQGNLNGTGGMLPLHQMMMDAYTRIGQIERNHRQELEQLAVELVLKEMGITTDDIDFDAKIINTDQFDTTDFNRDGGPQQNPDEVNVDDNEDGNEQPQQQGDVQDEIQLFQDLETLNLERAKRRLINAMTQGASKKGHYMYHLVGPEIADITGSEEILNLYGIMMSVNDANYWQFSDEMITSQGDSVAGKVQVERPGGDGEEEDGDEEDLAYAKPKVIARGINFPVLVHELIKGVVELIAVQGQPSDPEMFQQVSQHEDTLEKEMWDLRLGPAIWERIRSSFPEEVLMENGKELQNIMLQNIFKLPAKNFLVLLKEVMSGSENGKKLMSDLLKGIQEMLNQEEYETTMEGFQSDLSDISNETEDDEFTAYLRELGINPSDDDDEESDEDFLNQFRSK
jgi:hypothetical protein